MSSETELEFEFVFPLNDSQNIFIPTEETNSVIARKSVYEIIENAFKIERSTFGIINGARLTNLISQTAFILKKEVNQGMEFAEKVAENKHLHPERVKKDTYRKIVNVKNYIDRLPTNFIVLGYPCEKLIEIGRIIAQKLHYIHVYPNKLVNKEIYKRSPIGLWIYKNIKNGKKIPIDIIELLFKKEMCREVYKDHGVVISGFPTIPNFKIDDTLLPENNFSEQSVQIDFDEFPHKNRNESDLIESDDDVISSYDLINTKESNDGKNEEVKSECSESVSVADEIYETNDEDEFYFSGIEDCDDNEFPEQDVDENIITYAKNVEIAVPNNINDSIIFSFEYQLNIIKNLPSVPSVVVYVGNDESLDAELNQDIDDIGLQMYQTVLPSIDYFVACYSFDRLWILDGRLRLDLISEYIDKRLLYLHRKQFYVPEVIFPNQHIPEYFKKYLSKDTECDYDILRKTNCIEPKYKWFCYSKKHYCPVKSYEGKLVQGRIEYSVRFLGKLFMCSSKNSMNKFIKHPETYLIYNPNCRIALLAPPKFGTSILARTFKGCFETAEIYETKKFVFDIAINQNDAFAEAHILAMTESDEILKLHYDYYNQLRIDKIDEFLEAPLTVLMDVINGVNEIINMDSGVFCVIDSFKEVFSNECFLKKILPSNCFEKLAESNFNSPLAQLLFEENIYDIYSRDLMQNNKLAQSFIDWSLVRKKTPKELNEKRFAQWIIDNPPVDIQFWKLLARQNALPDYVIMPKCIPLEKLEDVYTTYKKKFRIYKQYINELFELYPNTFRFNFQIANSAKSYAINTSSLKEIRKYGKFIAQFRMVKVNAYLEKIRALKDFLTKKNILIIEADFSDLELNVIIFKILREYFINIKPKIFTPKSLKDFLKKTYILSNAIEYNEPEEGEESDESNENGFGEEEQEEELDSCNEENDKIDLNEFNLGPTGKYCPVCLHDDILLRKGFIKFSCEYRNHIIVFSSEICLNKFYESPEKYFYAKNTPVVPPPKFCIIGPNSINIILLARLLKKKFNISMKATHIFTKNLEVNILFDESKSTIAEPFEENFHRHFDKSRGVVYAGFPSQEHHVDVMEESNFYPEAAFLFEDKEDMFDSLLGHLITMSIEFRLLESSNLSFLKTKSEEVVRNIVDQKEKIAQRLAKLNIPVIRVKKNVLHDVNLFTAICDRINNNRERHAMLENIKTISMDTAENLITRGFCTMSRFQRAGPVFVSEINCLCNYEGMVQANKMFPCVYRQKIYFISGRQRLKQFCSNPQNYVETCNPFPLSRPIIILVKGAAKSGVTSLCTRISKEYGMKIFTEEDIKQFIKTELKGTRICDELERNNYLLNPYLFRISLGILKNSSATGIILDNFPITPHLLIETAKYGININAIYFIQMDFIDICNISKNVCPIKDFSDIAHDFEEYKKLIKEFDKNKEVQFFNIIKINSTKSRWQVWDACEQSLLKTARNIIAYKFLLSKTSRTSLKYLNVFYEEIFNNLDDPPFYCYICLKDSQKRVAYRYDWNNVGDRFYTLDCQLELTKPMGYKQKWLYKVYRFPEPYEFNDNLKPLLTNNSFASNFVQVGNKVYWTCDNHNSESILLGFSKYIPLEDEHMPQFHPILVENYPRVMVANNGYCIVSYDLAKKSDSDKKRFILLHYLANLGHMSFEEDNASNYYFQGNRELAVYYRGNIYLCTNESTCLEFLTQPEYYYNLQFLLPSEENIDYDLESEKLELGNLKPEILVKGLKALNTLRPKHFALNFEQSAAVYLGLFFKTFVATDKTRKDFYKHLIEKFVEECNAVIKKVKQFKMEANPFIQTASTGIENFVDDNQNIDNLRSLLAKFKCTCVADMRDNSCD